MKKRYFYNTLVIALSFFPFQMILGESIGSVLQTIEQNNTVLYTLRQQADAEKIGNKTGIYLENPEVEFGYLWGNGPDNEHRVDLSATQSFDFPTAYHYKRKVANEKNRQVDLKYQIEKKDILLEAQQICIQLIYQNALYVELEKRLRHAQQVVDAYQSRFDKGEVNVLDLNKAKFTLLNTQKEYNSSKTEKEYLLAELARLNGGNPVDFSFSTFEKIQPPLNFEQWYLVQKENNVLLRSLQQETKVSKESEKLQRSLNLPKFSAGYMSEKVASEHFQGVTVGVSIPLWENKNTVKQIKAQTQANLAAETDANLRFYNESKALYEKAIGLKKISDNYDATKMSDNTSDLLKKALDMGEISLIDYILELGIYYEVFNNMLETERDYQLTVAELMQWEL